MRELDTKKYPCTCGSSDGRRLFPDGKYYCFVCKKNFNAADGVESTSNTKTYRSAALTPEMIRKDFISKGFEDRWIVKPVTEFYKVKVGYNENGEIESHYYPYDNEACYKCRTLPKVFSWVKPEGGKSSDSLFGYELFNGGGRRIIVAEGEIDTLTIATMYYKKYKKIYPTVGLSSSAMAKSLIKHREWLRSFGEILLCFDQDEAGESVTAEAIKILGVDKVKIVRLPLNDANCVMTELGPDTLLHCIYEAAPHIPSGIITKEEIWDRLTNRVDKPSTPYPPCLQGLNLMLDGMRPNEIVLFTSGTGCGKSTMIREIELHLIQTTKARLGIIHFEQPPEKCAEMLVKMRMNRNIPEYKPTLEELRPGFEELFKDDRPVLLDHQGALSDGTIMDKLEYMCLSGCEYILLDHITILVSEGTDALTGNAAQDKVMSDLLKLVNKYPLWLGIVAHLRKVSGMQKSFESGGIPELDDIKGSGALKQIPFDIVGFGRNTTAEDPHERNAIHASVLKARETGKTGPLPATIIFNTKTGRLHDGMFYNEDDITDIDVDKTTGEMRFDAVESTAERITEDNIQIVEVK